MPNPCLLNLNHDTYSIEARYDDELSRFRAKKRWEALLREIYMLDPRVDFEFRFYTDPDYCFFYLTCELKSQVGKYIFFRLTTDHNHAAIKTLKVAHYTTFPAEIENDKSRTNTQKNFLIKLLQYFQAG